MSDMDMDVDIDRQLAWKHNCGEEKTKRKSESYCGVLVWSTLVLTRNIDRSMSQANIPELKLELTAVIS